MAYSVIPTVNVGDTIASSTWGNIVKADVEYLFSGRPKNSILRDNAATYTTTSTSFVDVDSTNLKHTVTLTGSTVLIGFSGAFDANAGTITPQLDVDIDGTRVCSAGADGIIAVVTSGTSGARFTVGSFTILKTGLSTGSRVFKLQWKISAAGTGYLADGSGVANADYIPSFFVLEVA